MGIVLCRALLMGGVAKWLGTGLQIRERRFESGHHLQFTYCVASFWLLLSPLVSDEA